MLFEGGEASTRFQTMSLGSAGPATIPNQRRGQAGGKETNKTSDIEGSTSELRYLKFTGRRPDLYNPVDIVGSTSKALHRVPRNKPEYGLCVDDIDYARPRPLLFRTGRETNPLDPDYKLPSTRPAAYPESKFVRDAHSIHDIEGSSAKPRYRFAQRDHYEVKDIDGAQSGWRPRHERCRRDAPAVDRMGVRDINDCGFRSTRSTNPLQPEYYMNGMDILDDPVKSKPKKLPEQHAGPYFPLHTADIEGAECGWKPPHAMQPPLELRRHWRRTNFVDDIEGAQPDTVKYAMRTDRNTDPLNPAYRGLDGELLPDPTKPDYAHLFQPRQAAAPSRPPSSAVLSRPQTTNVINAAAAPAAARLTTAPASEGRDRLVLVSRDGRPRVATAPASRKQTANAERDADIAAVRALSS